MRSLRCVLGVVLAGANWQYTGTGQLCYGMTACTTLLCRPEAAPAHYDFNSARLQGFAVSEVEPLLRRLQMTSLVKGLDKMQRLMGGTAAADPERLAALPAALEQIAASVSSNSQPSDDQQQQDDVLGVAPEGGPEGASNTAAHDDSNNTPAQGAVEQPSAAAVYETGLADNILANMPCVRLVSTAQGIQQLILQLQQQQQVSSRALVGVNDGQHDACSSRQPLQHQ